MTRTDNPENGLPDLKFINRIPIVDVSRALGFDVSDDGRILCPNVDKHPDDTYLKVLPSSNKAFCEVCRTGLMTVVDMVQKLGGIKTLPEVGESIAVFFDVPRIKKGSHLKNPEGKPVPPDCRDPLNLLIKSGVWAGFSVAVKLVIVTMLKFAKWDNNGEEGTLYMGYQAIIRYCGKGLQSPNAVRKAIRELISIGWLQRLPERPRGNSPVKGTSGYRLTPLSESVRKLADDTAEKFGKAIREEKAIRSQQKRERLWRTTVS